MKKRYLEGTDWAWTTKYSCYYEKFDDYVLSLTVFHEVEETYVDYGDSQTLLLEKNSRGLMYLPSDDYCLSVVYNPKHEIQEWYFDIIGGRNVEKKPFIWDLYLDIAVSPQRHITVLDEDELLEAKERGIIDESHVLKAYEVSKHIHKIVKNDQFMTYKVNEYYKNMLYKLRKYEKILRSVIMKIEDGNFSYSDGDYKYVVSSNLDKSEDYFAKIHLDQSYYLSPYREGYDGEYYVDSELNVYKRSMEWLN